MSGREEQLEHALRLCIPWVASSGRGAAQEALSVACHLTGQSPYDWTAHPHVLTERIALLDEPLRTDLERRKERRERRASVPVLDTDEGGTTP